ncbi:MAG TPA: HD domain-containing phosphohydrolase, partial [Thermoleophilaceae bacterium]|nr:HD domain-containing phosphohydrolase [Thermoleophilaceae bacterium]
MERRERVAVVSMALLFVVAAGAIALLVPNQREIDPVVVAALVLGYAAICRVEFEIGNGMAVPEALLFPPLLLLAPLPLVPLLVAGAFLLSRAPEFLRREQHIDRWLYSLSDSWFSIGPVLVLAALDPGMAHFGTVHVFALAFLAQLAAGTVAALTVEWIGIGTHPGDTIRSAGWAYGVDAVFWPVGLMGAVAAVDAPFSLLAIGPLVWLLTVFSRERRQRHAAAVELNRAYRGTVMLLSDVVECDDDYTAEHCRSVVELVNMVADEMGVSRQERQELEFAALLHDVGKIAIPKEILHKPGRLTDEEFAVMKTHTIEGQVLLDKIGGLLGRVGGIVRSCHERWDGGGYPDGLAGT